MATVRENDLRLGAGFDSKLTEIVPRSTRVSAVPAGTIGAEAVARYFSQIACQAIAEKWDAPHEDQAGKTGQSQNLLGEAGLRGWPTR